MNRSPTMEAIVQSYVEAYGDTEVRYCLFSKLSDGESAVTPKEVRELLERATQKEAQGALG